MPILVQPYILAPTSVEVAYGVNLYAATGGQTIDAGAWGELDLDTQRAIDASGWSSNTTAHTVTQSRTGKVILLGSVMGAQAADNAESFRARLEVNSTAISGTESRGYVTLDFNTDRMAHAILMAQVDGSAGNVYRVGIREDSGNAFTTPAGQGGNLIAFYVPDGVNSVWSACSSDTAATTAYQDVPLTAVAGGAGEISIATNEVTLPSTDKYLILYLARMGRAAGATQQDEAFYIQLVADSGGGYAAIAGTELLQFPSYYNETNKPDYTGSCNFGHLIYSGTANEKLKFQFKSTSGSSSTATLYAEGTSILVLKLPATAEYFSGYEASAAAPAATFTAIEMDTEYAKSGFTHDTATNPAEVTCPAEATSCLILGTFTGTDQNFVGGMMSELYSDTGGGFGAIAGTQGAAAGYGWGSPGMQHTASSIAYKACASSEKLALYGRYMDSSNDSPAALANSRLTILRLDNL